MTKLIYIFIFLLIANSNKSQTVSAIEASNHIGQVITVCSKVAGTFGTTGKSKTIYLNLEKAYPNNVFTVVIFEKNADNFNYNPLEFLKDKNICVTGKVSVYNNKPQIIVSKQDQIKIQK